MVVDSLAGWVIRFSRGRSHAILRRFSRRRRRQAFCPQQGPCILERLKGGLLQDGSLLVIGVTISRYRSGRNLDGI